VRPALSFASASAPLDTRKSKIALFFFFAVQLLQCRVGDTASELRFAALFFIDAVKLADRVEPDDDALPLFRRKRYAFMAFFEMGV